MEHPQLHPAITAKLRFFEYGHLPPHLGAISQPFHDLAHALVGTKDGGAVASDLQDGFIDATGERLNLDGPELTIALQKLLEAKDAAVRAALPPA